MGKSDIEGKSALVTGAGKGIGRAVAIRLAEMGVNVAVNYNRSEDAARDVVAQLGKIGVESFAVHADVRELEQVTAMVDRVTETWSGVDILVNNAGIISDGLLVRMTDEAWDSVIATNLNGTFYCTRAVLRGMIRRRWGRIINIGSGVGIRGNAGQANLSPQGTRATLASRRFCRADSGHNSAALKAIPAPKPYSAAPVRV